VIFERGAEFRQVQVAVDAAELVAGLAWDQRAADYAGLGPHGWAAKPSSGIWSVPEAQAGVLPTALGRTTWSWAAGTGCAR
jgi:hypothetical protein